MINMIKCSKCGFELDPLDHEPYEYWTGGSEEHSEVYLEYKVPCPNCSEYVSFTNVYKYNYTKLRR